MSDIMNGYATIKDYTIIPRHVLEKRAKVLDAITLYCAGIYHGTDGADFLAQDLIDTFTSADFKNYFNQDTFKGE
jgi:hypothetical protein